MQTDEKSRKNYVRMVKQRAWHCGGRNPSLDTFMIYAIGIYRCGNGNVRQRLRKEIARSSCESGTETVGNNV